MPLLQQPDSYKLLIYEFLPIQCFTAAISTLEPQNPILHDPPLSFLFTSYRGLLRIEDLAAGLDFGRFRLT